MAFSGTLQLTSDYVPGYGASDSRSFSKSAVSRRTLAVLPCSSCRINKLCIENGHLKSATNKTSFVCRASSSGHRRNNPDFSRNNKHGFRGRNRRNEDRDGLVDGGLEDDILSSKNGPILSLSSSPKFQATSSPGPKEKEIVELFRKVQAQLRARAAAKKEEKKTEEASKGQGGKDSETVDSLLKLLRKHSGEQSKKQVSNFNSEKQLQRDDDASERQDHSSNRFDSQNKDHNATPFTRPASSFRRNSPVPRHKSQASYSSEAIFDQASSYSVTWTQKKDQVESRDEPEYEPEPESAAEYDEPEPESAAEYDEPEPEAEYESESEPGLAILDSVSELKPESFYQDEDEDEEEDHDVVVDELSDDDESLNTEEETANDEDLSALKLVELRAIAKTRGLKGISKMKKADLLNLLGSNNKA
ncbi:Rho termination factor N-terminal [Arabidopsis suecica]|uniref:Rho termination factor N-terminal n=1 Tax=Arabidopsis suecica TaxID=45249 RepID=A0A8T2AI33_ARASU|nr:Rho termination factor N-terminal [Arabidopsis suecica]